MVVDEHVDVLFALLREVLGKVAGPQEPICLVHAHDCG
jgi:hypothetical protein